MTPSPVLHLVVPGPLEQRTGGYLYDARMAAGLQARGWTVIVHSLPGRFPDADQTARDALDTALAGAPDGAVMLLDGLAMGSLPGVVAAHRERLRLLALVHHPLADETGLAPGARERFLRLEREALTAVHGVVVTSAYTRRRLERYGVPATRVRAVVPGTDPAPQAVGSGPTESPCLLCVGTVSPRKAQGDLVDALAMMADLPWRCVLAGSVAREPAYADAVRRRAEAAGLAGRIDFRGELDEDALSACYHAADLFVLPSHYEGYGMALSEALARGLPVVSTTGGAIPDTVPPTVGVLVAPGDTRALASALRGLVTDADRRGRLAAAAREHGAALPTWQAQAGAFADAVQELLA